MNTIKNLIFRWKRDRFLSDFGTLNMSFSASRITTRDYSGDCMRVRRSSDNTTTEIGFIDGLLDESALTTFVGANDGFVERWYNQGSLGGYFNQTTNANQPRVVSSGVIEKLNSKVCINYFSTTCVMNSTTGAIYNNFTMAYAGTATATAHEILGASGSSGLFYFKNTFGGAFNFRRDGTQPSFNFSITSSTKQYLLSAVRSGGLDIEAFIDGGSEGIQLMSGEWTNLVSQLDMGLGKTQELTMYLDQSLNSNISEINNNLNDFYSIY